MSERKEEKKGIMSKYRFKPICIFGETDEGKDREFLTAAKELGTALAARKTNFVYGGDIQGLRRSVAISAITSGSKGLSVKVKELDSHIFSLDQEL